VPTVTYSLAFIRYRLPTAILPLGSRTIPILSSSIINSLTNELTNKSANWSVRSRHGPRRKIPFLCCSALLCSCLLIATVAFNSNGRYLQQGMLYSCFNWQSLPSKWPTCHNRIWYIWMFLTACSIVPQPQQFSENLVAPRIEPEPLDL
jgi:hypothetical protein